MSPVQRGSRDWKPLLHRLYKGGPSGRTLRINRMFICESNTDTKSSEKPWDARKDSVALIVFVFGVLLTSRFFRIWIPFSLLGWSNAWVTSLETSTSWDGWSTKRREAIPWNYQARFHWLSSRLSVSMSCASNVIISSTSTFRTSRNRWRIEGASRSPVTDIQIGSLETVNGTVQVLTSYADLGSATSHKARVDHSGVSHETKWVN